MGQNIAQQQYGNASLPPEVGPPGGPQFEPKFDVWSDCGRWLRPRNANCAVAGAFRPKLACLTRALRFSIFSLQKYGDGRRESNRRPPDYESNSLTVAPFLRWRAGGLRT